jgi:hypothetical protein
MVMDPYNGPEEGRVFSYKEFIDHWQWDNSDNTYSLIMEVVKGKQSKEDTDIKENTFHIEDGGVVIVVYESPNTYMKFMLVEFDANEMVIEGEILRENSSMGGVRVLNDEPTPNFWIYGSGQFYLCFHSLSGEGEITLVYESNDGEVTYKLIEGNIKEE